MMPARDYTGAAHYAYGMDDAATLANDGIKLLEAGRFDEAADAFKAAQRLDPRSAELAFNLGLARLRGGRPRDARIAFEQSLALGGRNADLFANLGLALFDLGKLSEAEAAYGEALELDHHHPEANNNLGVLMFGLSKFAEARELFQKAISSRADYYDAWFNLRDTCAELGLDAERERAASEVARLEDKTL